MNRIDELALDGRLLTMLIAVYETGSVTAAALSMNVTQSTVSHGLNRLRNITGDALFVPMGRGITPTEKADELVDEARRILKSFERFSRSQAYDPAIDTRPFVIAASDYEIEIIVKPLLKTLRAKAPSAKIHIMRALSQNKWAELLRSGDADLVLAPELVSDESDIKQQRILDDDLDICFFDPAHQSAPDTLDRYCAAHHVIMSPGRIAKTITDDALAQIDRRRHVAVSMPSFLAIATILRGTDLITLMPSRLKDTIFADFASCPPPFEVPHDAISQIWHTRSHASARHRWLRGQVRDCIAGQSDL